MLIVFLQKTNSLWQELLEPLRREFPDVEIVTDTEDARLRVAEADIIVGGKIERRVFEEAVNLKLVVVPFTGVNHLPFDLFRERGVKVANSHGNAWYVAERTVGMILAFYGRIIDFHNDLRDTQWHGFWVGQGLDDSWESVEGKTAAILGTGEIGRNLARQLRTFHVRTVGYRRRRVSAAPEEFDEVVYDLDAAVDTADIVVVALPSTPETQGLIGPREIKRMKGKFLVNIGRGDIVDEKALYEGLKDGILRGAAIDCWYTYPRGGTKGAPSRYDIHTLDNIILSPHVGGFVPQAVRRGINQACDNIAAFLRDGVPRFNVDIDAGY